MEKNHSFIFSTGTWFGEGRIRLNMIDEDLFFFTNWNLHDRDDAGKIQGVQEIQIQGLSENMRNEITFYDFLSEGFAVEMENPNLGKVQGFGLSDPKVIAWEFRDKERNFEGFESYHLQEDGTYRMHAEYVTSDQFRTEIEGKIWLQPDNGDQA